MCFTADVCCAPCCRCHMSFTCSHSFHRCRRCNSSAGLVLCKHKNTFSVLLYKESSAMATEMDLVGCAVSVKLTDNTELNGTVFTYVPAREILVLATNAASDSPSFKMIRTTFIQSFTVETDLKNVPADQRLPRSLDAYAQLPPVTKAMKDFTSAKKKLLAEEKKRDDYLQKVNGAPVSAADLFLEISRVFPQAQWNADEECFTVEDVVVLGDPDWSKPTVKEISGCENSSNKDRVLQLVKKFSSD